MTATEVKTREQVFPVKDYVFVEEVKHEVKERKSGNIIIPESVDDTESKAYSCYGRVIRSNAEGFKDGELLLISSLHGCTLSVAGEPDNKFRLVPAENILAHIAENK